MPHGSVLQLSSTVTGKASACHCAELGVCWDRVSCFWAPRPRDRTPPGLGQAPHHGGLSACVQPAWPMTTACRGQRETAPTVASPLLPLAERVSGGAPVGQPARCPCGRRPAPVVCPCTYRAMWIGCGLSSRGHSSARLPPCGPPHFSPFFFLASFFSSSSTLMATVSTLSFFFFFLSSPGTSVSSLRGGTVSSLSVYILAAFRCR